MCTFITLPILNQRYLPLLSLPYHIILFKPVLFKYNLAIKMSAPSVQCWGATEPVNGYVAGSGTGADGGGKAGNNAVRRHAGTGNATIRLPKSIAMFASRACRSSIMIGDSLTRSKMETILRTMQNLDHPWECAHGRPTIRHVRDLLEDLNKDLDL